MTPTYRTIIKFSHAEVEALLDLFPDTGLSENEKSAREKLKMIYARQILSHERRLAGLRDDSLEREEER